jgi:hypothetical protein
MCIINIFFFLRKRKNFYCYALKRYSRETFELPIVQILVLVARSLTEITTEDDRSGERFHVAA